MNSKYCYWSVCDGAYGAMMEHCVRSARAAGVFKEFHILTDRPLDGCECYDAFQFEKTHGLFKLHYLKVGMSRLNFEYFIWLDADTVFVRNPVDVLGPLGRSPIHVPLELNLSALTEMRSPEREARNGTQNLGTSGPAKERDSLGEWHTQFRREGIVNQVYLCGSAFWIVHHDAIETVYDLALGFWHKAKEAGMLMDISAALGYAMQILCGAPEAHALSRHPDLWASDDAGCFREVLPGGTPWVWRHPLGAEGVGIRPAIIHVPRSKELFSRARPPGDRQIVRAVNADPVPPSSQT